MFRCSSFCVWSLVEAGWYFRVMFCSQLYCNIFGAGHSMSEIHLKLMLVQMMPASSPVGLFLLHPLNPTEIQQWEQDQTFPCMCMNKNISMSKCVHPSWAMKHGLPGQKRGGKGAVLDTIIDSSSGRKQSSCGRPTGGITSVQSSIMSVSLGTSSSHKVLKMQTVLFLLKNIRKQCWQHFPLSQSPTCYLASNVLYGGALSSEVKSGI